MGCTSLTTLGVSSWCILSYKTVGYRHYNYCFHFLNLLEHRLHLSSRSHHYSHCTVLQCRLLLQCVAREGALNKIGFNHLLEIATADCKYLASFYCCLSVFMSLSISATYQQQIILGVQKIVLPGLRVVIICRDVLMVCP